MIILFWILFTLIISMIVFSSIRNGISPTPTSSKVKAELFKNLPADITGKIYELGSGWGTLAIPLAKRYPQCSVIAYETSVVPYLFNQVWKWCTGLKNLQIKREDFYNGSLKDASMIVCYLFPDAMSKLKTKFLNEVPPNTLIISHTFAIPGWIPNKFKKTNDIYNTPIYYYVISEQNNGGD